MILLMLSLMLLLPPSCGLRARLPLMLCLVGFAREPADDVYCQVDYTVAHSPGPGREWQCGMRSMKWVRFAGDGAATFLLVEHLLANANAAVTPV